MCSCGHCLSRSPRRMHGRARALIPPSPWRARIPCINECSKLDETKLCKGLLGLPLANKYRQNQRASSRRIEMEPHKHYQWSTVAVIAMSNIFTYRGSPTVSKPEWIISSANWSEVKVSGCPCCAVHVDLSNINTDRPVDVSGSHKWTSHESRSGAKVNVLSK